MPKTSSSLRLSGFRNQVVAWLLLMIFLLSFAPSVSLAQQPTAMIKTLSGTVLVSGQAVTVGTLLQAGETIQTQVGASLVLELSDGSELHLGEKTQITVADLAQTSTRARVSRVKLLWGWVRAFLSPQHQIEGSAFNIETPNALIGVKFSEPDIEVSYNQEKAETVGIAHTVELLAKNLLTDEKVLVPVGSSVIITSTTTKVIAGILAIAESTGTGATGAESASTESAGMGTGTKVAIGVGAAAAAVGVAALAVSSGDGNGGNGSTTNINLAGTWRLMMTGIQYEYRNGQLYETYPDDDEDFVIPTRITQTGNTFSASWTNDEQGLALNGTINGSSVNFELQTSSGDGYWEFNGLIEGDTISGNYSGNAFDTDPYLDSNGWFGISTYEYSGTFTVTVTP